MSPVEVHYEEGVRPCRCPSCVLPSLPGDIPAHQAAPVSRETVPAFDVLHARIRELELEVTKAKHVTWSNMRLIRANSQLEEAHEMRELRALVEPIEREIEAMKAAIAEHHADKATVIFVPKPDPVLMVF